MAEDTTRAARPPSGYAAGMAAGDEYKTSRPPTMSGLSEDEARSFHKMFVISFLGFLGIAIVAHILVWQWRPWIPGADGYPAVQAVAVAGP